MADTSTASTAAETGAEQTAATLLERMVGSGIGEERARAHIARGVIRVGGETVTDPTVPVPWPTAWVVTAE